jgi:hypothetical protein
MASASDHEKRAEQLRFAPSSRRLLPSKGTAALAALLALAVLAAGCGGSRSPDAAGGGGDSSVLAAFEAYARCMRSHGIPDFPDPTTSPGGGVSFQISGGPGSDLNHNDPRFTAADRACRGLLPGAEKAQAPLSAGRIAAEVSWARCMRSHGLPGFPDPNSQGAFDSSTFDETSPAFQTASDACKSRQPTGPTPVVPGRG